MQRFDVALGGLRSTLLAACGLGVGIGVGACTGGNPFKAAGQCKKPTPVLSKDQDTGYVQCADGAVNRASAVGCIEPVVAQACRGTEARRACETHADCTDAPHGFCRHDTTNEQGGEFCGCIYPCVSDDECAAGQACICPGVDESGRGWSVARCAPAECKVDADCPSGQCGVTMHSDGCSFDASLRCREPGDACHSDADCPSSEGCAALGDGGFECRGGSCKMGRPLTVDSGVRVADVSSQRWGVVRHEGLAAARDRAQYWLEVAQMEHASVASFARFVHELMGFGGPTDLLADALAAAADEVRHAEQTFALASAYAGEPIGPGALRVDDLRPTRDPELFVTRLIIEGCVGETLGAAEMLASLDGDLDSVLRPVIEQIAADETRHAALAWRTLRWFAPRVDPAVIERAFERALSQIERVDDDPLEQIDPICGRLGSAEKHRVHALAIASVIEPCCRELQRDSIAA
jgi:hypothetical protein